MSGMSVIRELFRPDRVRIYEMTTMRPRITLSSMHLWTRGWQTSLGYLPSNLPAQHVLSDCNAKEGPIASTIPNE